MPQLVVVEGPNLGRTYLLRGEMRIGNDPSSDVVLGDRRGGACQATITRKDRRTAIEAIGDSKNLSVNGRRVESAVLAHGDLIAAGSTKFLYSEDDPPSKEVLVEDDQAAAPDAMTSQILTRQEHYKDVESVLGQIPLPDQSSRRLASLFRVASVANEGLELDALLDLVVKIVFADFPGERVMMVLKKNGMGGRANEYAWERRSGRVEGKVRYSRTIVDRVLATQASVVTSNAMDDERFLSGESIVEQSILSAMCVPLICREKVLGALSIDSARREEAFTEDDLDQLTKMAIQAAVAIENALTREEPKRFSDNLKRLSRATQFLSRYLEREPILKEGVEVAWTLFQFMKASILLVDPGGTKLRMAYAKGIPPEEWDAIVVPMGEGLCGRCAAENRMILSPEPDTGIPPPGVVPTMRPKYKTDSFLILPILSRTDELDDERRLIGVLNVTDRADGAPITRIDRELMTILASQIGIALTNAELYEKATVDPLTRLYVRRYFFQRLIDEIERTRLDRSPLTLMMLDLDHFKSVNDTHGHPTGDVVLREVARRVRSSCRPEDVAARYGGEEFSVILPRTSAKDAGQVAEGVRRSVASHPVAGPPEIPITISIGVAEIREEEGVETLIRRADQALYRAKERGRDRVVLHR